MKEKYLKKKVANKILYIKYILKNLTNKNNLFKKKTFFSYFVFLS